MEDEEKEATLIPEKRTRLDSNSTDVEPSFELELGKSPVEETPKLTFFDCRPSTAAGQLQSRTVRVQSQVSHHLPARHDGRAGGNHGPSVRPQHQGLLLHPNVSGLLNPRIIPAPRLGGLHWSLPPSYHLREVLKLTRTSIPHSGLQELEEPEKRGHLQPTECHQALERSTCLVHLRTTLQLTMM